jgi:hypothetical protein
MAGELIVSRAADEHVLASREKTKHPRNELVCRARAYYKSLPYNPGGMGGWPNMPGGGGRECRFRVRRRPTGMPILSPIARPSPPPTPPLCHILGSAFSVRTVVAASLARPLTSVMDTNFTSLRRRERMYIRMLPMPCPDFGFDVLRPLRGPYRKPDFEIDSQLTGG